MEVNYHNDQIPFVVVDCLYNNEEESEIMMELDYLSDSRRLIPPFEDELAAKEVTKTSKMLGVCTLISFSVIAIRLVFSQLLKSCFLKILR